MTGFEYSVHGEVCPDEADPQATSRHWLSEVMVTECPKKHLREVVEVFPGMDTQGLH